METHYFIMFRVVSLLFLRNLSFSIAKAFIIRSMDSKMQNREKAINYSLYNYNITNLNMSKGGQPVDVDITKVTP